jgi:integrase
MAPCSPTLKPIVITGLHTGFRKSAVLSPTWANVDFDHRLMTVEAAYAKNHEIRRVPMTSVLTEMLQAIRIDADQRAPVSLNRHPYREVLTACETAL